MELPGKFKWNVLIFSFLFGENKSAKIKIFIIILNNFKLKPFIFPRYFSRISTIFSEQKFLIFFQKFFFNRTFTVYNINFIFLSFLRKWYRRYGIGENASINMYFSRKNYKKITLNKYSNNNKNFSSLLKFQEKNEENERVSGNKIIRKEYF